MSRPEDGFDAVVFFHVIEAIDDLLQASAIHAVVFFALEGDAGDIVVAFDVKERERHGGTFLYRKRKKRIAKITEKEPK